MPGAHLLMTRRCCSASALRAARPHVQGEQPSLGAPVEAAAATCSAVVRDQAHHISRLQHGLWTLFCCMSIWKNTRGLWCICVTICSTAAPCLSKSCALVLPVRATVKKAHADGHSTLCEAEHRVVVRYAQYLAALPPWPSADRRRRRLYRTVFSSCCSCGTASAWLKLFSASLQICAAAKHHTVWSGQTTSLEQFLQAHFAGIISTQPISFRPALTDCSAEAVRAGQLDVVGGRDLRLHTPTRRLHCCAVVRCASEPGVNQ